MSEVSDIPFGRVLVPMERISDTLFGLILALTFICSLGVATAGNIKIQTMLIGALGCNLAWGIVDGGLYLLARINEQGGKILTLRAIRRASDPAAAQRSIAEPLPPEWQRFCRRSNWNCFGKDCSSCPSRPGGRG